MSGRSGIGSVRLGRREFQDGKVGKSGQEGGYVNIER
jgi:hypothetical protein